MEFIGNLCGGLLGLLVMGCAFTSCTKAEPRVEAGRFLAHDSTADHCSYMFSDGSIAHYDRHGECPARMFDELEAE